MNGIRIGGSESEYLDVNITRKAARDSPIPWDDSWLDSTVEVKVGGFRGLYGAQFLLVELFEFRTDLASLYSFKSQEAVFASTEGQLSIRISGNGLGGFTAACESTDNMGAEPIRLSFQLKFDQSEIPGMLTSLDLVLADFRPEN